MMGMHPCQYTLHMTMARVVENSIGPEEGRVSQGRLDRHADARAAQ